MSDNDNIIADTTVRIFRDLADPQTVNLSTDGAWRQPLWDALEELGLTRTWVPDTLNGAGAGVMDGFEVLRVAGANAVAVPLAETLIAGWALSNASLETPLGCMAIITPDNGSISVGADGKLSGRATKVAFARDAANIVVEIPGPDGPTVAQVAASACTIEPHENLAKESRDTVVLNHVSPIAIGSCAPTSVSAFALGAAVRSMQMAGALQAILDISVQYSTERVAFERPIGKFQAVQHNLARLAGEVAAANAAANSVAFTLEQEGQQGDSVFFEIASAKVRVGEAANEGAMIGHQTHGAIGFTQEHILHRYTHRLWSWRDDFGDENYWALRLGEHVAGLGADEFWPTLTAI